MRNCDYRKLQIELIFYEKIYKEILEKLQIQELILLNNYLRL
jgi:hypothetical protein